MRTCFLLIGLLLALAAPAYAQNAQIVGTVKDATGGVVPGATVTAKNGDTGFARSAVTEANGEYRLPSLPPGRYSVTTELTGFSTETRPDIVLIIEQTAIINFTLKTAALAETVTVTGESPIVDVTRSDVSTAVSTQQIQDLPVASRRWIDLAMLTPGTSQDNIRGFFYRGNVNLGAGTREYSNAFVVDGVNNTWAEMGEPRQNFAMDAIQEFKVSTSTYKAEYGLATGGVLSVVTKSGTNQLHGSGLLFFRDASITAKEFFQTTKPDYRRYQYGGTVGGPKYIKALKAPLPQISMIPTGGVNLETAAEFIQAGADALGIGGELVLPSALKSGDMKSISETARKFLAIVRDARTAKAADP